MTDIAATLRTGLESRGWQVQALEIAPLSAHFTVSGPITGQDCEVDILKGFHAGKGYPVESGSRT